MIYRVPMPIFAFLPEKKGGQDAIEVVSAGP